MAIIALNLHVATDATSFYYFQLPHLDYLSYMEFLYFYC